MEPINILILEDSQERIDAFKIKFADKERYSLDIVEHAQDAIDLLDKKEYHEVYLDHDLGGQQITYDKEDCGTVVAEYIKEKDIKIKYRIIIHSFNVPRAFAMQHILNQTDNTVKYIPGVWTE